MTEALLFCFVMNMRKPLRRRGLYFFDRYTALNSIDYHRVMTQHPSVVRYTARALRTTLSPEPERSFDPNTDAGRFQYKWILLLVVSGGGFLSIMNAGMVNIGAPGIMEDFQTSVSLIVWVNLAFVMGTTVPLLPLSRISDVFGRKRLYLLGALIVPAGLVLSTFSQDLTQLIVARVVTALGSSMILANDNALLTQAFPASERGKAQGLINMAFGLGIGLSFFLGGVLIDIFDWRALFWARIPFQLLLAFSV